MQTNRRDLLLRSSLATLVCAHAETGAAQDANSEHVTGSGRVIAIDSRSRSITIRHGDIPTFMLAMQMTFPVARTSLLAGVKAGDEVEFTLRRRNGTIERIGLKAP